MEIEVLKAAETSRCTLEAQEKQFDKTLDKK
jgi:hypothetical protein